MPALSMILALGIGAEKLRSLLSSSWEGESSLKGSELSAGTS
jgi:hypothetical protein